MILTIILGIILSILIFILVIISRSDCDCIDNFCETISDCLDGIEDYFERQNTKERFLNVFNKFWK